MSSELRSYEILSVEDSPCDRRLISEFLPSVKLRCRIHFVEDGEEALDFLRRKPPYTWAPEPDLVLLDLNLPRMDGREVLKVIKSDPALKQIPVIVFSTSAAAFDVLSSYRLYANAYFTKPQDLEGFAQIMKKIEDHWLKGAEIPLHGVYSRAC
jgi:two-component system, chemotaxis family, response regulator Rcp1